MPRNPTQVQIMQGAVSAPILVVATIVGLWCTFALDLPWSDPVAPWIARYFLLMIGLLSLSRFMHFFASAAPWVGVAAWVPWWASWGMFALGFVLVGVLPLGGSLSAGLWFLPAWMDEAIARGGAILAGLVILAILPGFRRVWRDHFI
jgi:hypothetical protein